MSKRHNSPWLRSPSTLLEFYLQNIDTGVCLKMKNSGKTCFNANVLFVVNANI